MRLENVIDYGCFAVRQSENVTLSTDSDRLRTEKPRFSFSPFGFVLW